MEALGSDHMGGKEPSDVFKTQAAIDTAKQFQSTGSERTQSARY